MVRARLATRLSHAIDWRVRQQYEDERAVILGMNKSVVDLSAETTNQILTLTEAVTLLEKRVAELERKCPGAS
jgi:cation diffusion facilitator CzcD-associated flavoprotein CzcO